MADLLASLLTPNFLTNPIIVALEISVIRAVAGYFEKAAEKGWEGFSFTKLGATILRVIPQSLGIEALLPGAGVGALFTDYVIKKAKK